MTQEQMIDQAVKAVSSTVTHYGPIAWQTTLQVERINAIGSLINLLVEIIIAIALLCFAWFKARVKFQESYNDDWGPSIGWGLALIVPTTIGLAVGVTCLPGLSSPWIYVGIAHPELALAHDALTKALGQ